MTKPKKSGQQQPSRQATDKTGIGDRFRVLQRHLTLADKILTGAVIVVGAIFSLFLQGGYWPATICTFVSLLLLCVVFAHLHWRHGFQKQQTLSLVDIVCCLVAGVSIIVAFPLFYREYPHSPTLTPSLTEQATDRASIAKTRNEPAEETTSTPLPPHFRLVVEWTRQDIGLRAPRTDFMLFYTLNNIPTLSPIDILMRLKVVNLQANATKVEAWALSTGNSKTGPWTALQVLSDDYPELYVPLIHPESAHRAILSPLLPRILVSKPIASEEARIGYVLAECPTAPRALWRVPNSDLVGSTNCLQRYLRMNLREQNGGEAQLVSECCDTLPLGEHNAELNNPGDKPRDLSKMRILRPYPRRLFWAGQPPKAFGNDAVLPTPKPKRGGKNYSL